MTFKQIFLLFWFLHVPAIVSIFLAFFLPEKLFSGIGMYHSVKGMLIILATLYLNVIAWGDFLFFLKKLNSAEKPAISLFVGFLTVLSGYVLLFLGEATMIFFKGGSLDESFFKLNSFPWLLLIVFMFFMHRAFDHDVSEE